MIKHETIKSKNVCQLEIQIAALAELIMLKNLDPLSRMNIWNFLCVLFWSENIWNLLSPWIRRTFNGFLTVLSPSPQIRRNYFSAWPAICSCWRWNTNHLLCLALPAYIVIYKTLSKFNILLPTVLYLNKRREQDHN